MREKTFRAYDQDQMLLMPRSMADWLAEQLDLAAILDSYASLRCAGNPVPVAGMDLSGPRPFGPVSMFVRAGMLVQMMGRGEDEQGEEAHA